MDVLGEDGDALGVDGAEIGVLKEADQVSLGCLLPGTRAQRNRAPLSGTDKGWTQPSRRLERRRKTCMAASAHG